MAILIAGALAISLGVLSAFLVIPSSGQPSGPPRAAIVDQLSVRAPRPPFVEAVTSMLEQVGYSVDYYPGEEVTVDFYRDLPTHGYDLVLLRVHSGLIDEPGRENDAFLFTNEPYNQTEYLEDQRERRVIVAAYSDQYELGSPLAGSLQYYQFGIVADFIESSMRGQFDDSTVILMGCNGLTSNTMAKAFVQKGAKIVFSWDGLVTGTHTDAATERLLQHYLVEGLSAEEAVTQTMAEVGPDPFYDSVLLSYPPEG